MLWDLAIGVGVAGALSECMFVDLGNKGLEARSEMAILFPCRVPEMDLTGSDRGIENAAADL